MNLSDELEGINNGQYRTVEDVHDTIANGSGGHGEILELLDNSIVDNSTNQIIVDRKYADDKIYGPNDPKDKLLDYSGKIRSALENSYKEFASSSYESGISSGERKANELNSRLMPSDAWERIRDKASSKDRSAKVNESIMSAGAFGTWTGWQTGSRTLGLTSSVITAGTILRQGKIQGERDKLEKEGAKGWAREYGDYQVTIS